MRLGWRAAASFLLFAAAAWSSGPVEAQGRATAEDVDPVARERFQLATELYRQGRFSESADEFDRVYETTHVPEILHNIYLARRDAGQKRRAAEALRQYLATASEIPDRAVMEGRLATLEREIAEDDTRTQTETPPEEPEEVAPPEGTTPPQHEAAPEPTPAPPAPAEGPSLLLPALTLGLGGAVLLAGGAMAIVASTQHGQLEDDCGLGLVCPYDKKDDVDSFRSSALTADILFVTGGVIAAAGLTWLIVALASGPSEDEPAPVSLGCGPSGCALAGVF